MPGWCLRAAALPGFAASGVLAGGTVLRVRITVTVNQREGG